jgi:excisionase family DNA binding protein
MPSTMIQSDMPVVLGHEDDILLTFKETMKMLRLSRSGLYREMWDGNITGYKIGSTWRFYRNDARQLLRQVIYHPEKRPA